MLNAIAQANKVFEGRGISLPARGQSTTTEEIHLEKGIAVQKSIFGAEHIDIMRANAPEKLRHIQ
jgi:4-carboxymuconolactone decarboxylase